MEKHVSCSLSCSGVVVKNSTLTRGVLGVSLSLFLSACLPTTETTRTTNAVTTNVSTGGTGNTLVSSATSSGSSASIPAGVRAVKIVFRQANPQGSFDAPPTNGTVAVPGGGLRATRLFNADGSLLATGGVGTPGWPKWITAIELGISGTLNTSAPNPDCARFSASNEDANSLCTWGGSVSQPCGAPPGLYRVAEYDCADAAASGASPALKGTGGPNDGIYVRVQLSRDTNYLGAGENIMAVLEYSASAFSAAPSDPTVCFTGGTFNPSAPGCADQVWQTFLKHDPSELVQPFLMLVPPSYAHSVVATNSSGTGLATKQFFLPIATDPTLSVFQMSRISGRSGDATFIANCHTNSALCVGVVLYSLTLYRI